MNYQTQGESEHKKVVITFDVTTDKFPEIWEWQKIFMRFLNVRHLNGYYFGISEIKTLSSYLNLVPRVEREWVYLAPPWGPSNLVGIELMICFYSPSHGGMRKICIRTCVAQLYANLSIFISHLELVKHYHSIIVNLKTMKSSAHKLLAFYEIPILSIGKCIEVEKFNHSR